MSRLCIDLPPLAPDYSGAASALFDLGGIVVMHDASGCTGNYTGFDEPRWLGSRSAVFCSGMRRMDAVLGNDDKFVNKTIEAAKSLNPTIIAYLGSPVPMVIGTDLEGMAAETENACGVPSFGFNTTGQYYYDKGASDVFVSLIKRFAKKQDISQTEKTANILGLLPIDFGNKGNSERICSYIESLGYKINSSFATGLTVEQIKRCGNADISIVVSRSGLEAARLIKKKFGVPYICGVPLHNSSVIEKKLNEEYSPKMIGCNDGGILIIHEQIFANSIREEIAERSDVSVTVASLFGIEKSISLEQDITLANETAVKEVINSGRYSVILADPMIKKLLKRDNVKFVSLPHVAVSSKLHWDDYVDYLGQEMSDIISECII